MGFSRKLQWLKFGVIPFLLFSGCGDLEPEMQDTRSVVLKMNLNQRSSSRSSQISQAEVSNHKTHLILALPAGPAGEELSSSYRNYDSIPARKVMTPPDNKVSLEIPLNTPMKIFAFLFKKDYTMLQLTEMDVDDPEAPKVGYYGQLTTVSGEPSQTFSIDANTNDLTLGITLKSAGTTDDTDPDTDPGTDPGTDPDTDPGTDPGTGTDTAPAAPVIETVTAIASPTSDSTPDYTFASTKAGTITYGGSCSSGITSALSGNNTITFIALSDRTYYDCTIKVTDSNGNESNTLTIPTFTVQSGLIAHYPLDGNAEDATSNNHDLTVTGANLSEGRDNLTNTAYYFDGTDDYLTKSISPSLTLSNFTVSLWVKSATNQNLYTGIFSCASSPSGGFQISYASDKTNYRYRSTTSDAYNFGVSDNTWKFLAVTYDGTKTTLYYDGVKEDDFSGGDDVFTNFTIGRNRAGNKYLNGSIDEVRIYERALSESEITELFSLQ